MAIDQGTGEYLLVIPHADLDELILEAIDDGYTARKPLAEFLTDKIENGDANKIVGRRLSALVKEGKLVMSGNGIVRDTIGQDNPEYRFADSLTRVQIVHKPTKTVLQVRSSNPKTTMGLVNTPWVIADEPGAWAVNDGALMFDAISTSLGKPNSPLKALFIGTLAPAQGGWWHDLIDRGSHHSTYVQAIQGDRETWDSWQTIRKANPLTAISPEFRKQLLEERDAARGDPRLKARFLSYRLNVPTADESEVLLTVEDFKLATAREVAPATGQPIVGVDLGQNRSAGPQR